MHFDRISCISETDDGKKTVRGKRDTMDPKLGIVDLDGDGRANAVVRLSNAEWKVEDMRCI